eukprot:158782_1
MTSSYVDPLLLFPFVRYSDEEFEKERTIVDMLYWETDFHLLNEACRNTQLGDYYQKSGEFTKSISCYSRGLLLLDKVKMSSNETLNVRKNPYRQFDIIQSRLNVYITLEKYDKALRDLNFLISNTCTNCYRVTVRWLLHRADIYYLLGNTTTALNEYQSTKERINEFKVKDDCATEPFAPEECDRCAKYMETKRDIGQRIEVAKAHLNSVQCVQNINYSKLIKLSNHGWKQLILMNNKTEQLPFKSAHSMVSYRGKIYCFGTSQIDDYNLFIQITIRLDVNRFKWKRLSFPQSLRRKFNNNFDGHKLHKWNHKLVLIGRTLYDIFVYDIQKAKWKQIKVKSIKYTSHDFSKEHSSVIVQNTVYLSSYDSEKLSIYALNLLTREWVWLFEKEQTDVMLDEIMWYDSNRGALGSLFIAFGFDICYYSSCVLRFDIYERKLYSEPICGNGPHCRGGVASVSTLHDSGVLLFGMRNNCAKGFGDCFEYENASQRWKMIYSNVAPPNRGDGAICRMERNLLVLYGGMMDEFEASSRLANDLWIMDLNECETKRVKLRKCNNRKCAKTSNDCALYKCKRCRKRRYCSIHCQKRHWKKHKKKCALFV